MAEDPSDLHLPGLAVAEAGLRPIRRIAVVAALAGLALVEILAAGLRLPGVPVLAEARRSGVAAVALAALLVALAGLAGVWEIAGARRGAALPPSPPVHRPRWRRWLRPEPTGDARRVSRAARLPQALVVVPLAGVAAVIGWTIAATLSPASAVVPDACFALGGAAIVLAFPWLIAERTVAALAPPALPEADALRRLLLVPVLAWPALGVLEIATGLGLSLAARITGWLALLLALLAAELAVRAVLRLFLPPPAPAQARAAVGSTLARLLAAGARSRGNLAAPIRAHLGIDFARSWALSYARAALPALTLLLLLLGWGLSGVVLVPLDQRAIYERFGAPARVLRPGAHLILPWPLGKPRWLDYGTLHELPLGDADAAALAAIPAEAVPPASADRRWEQGHPAEVLLLIASQRNGAQNAGQQAFQAVSLDLRIVWRVGLSDADALQAAYRLSDPDALVRAATGRAVAAFFAARTLDQVLGESRTAMSAALRGAVQARLDRFASGIEVVALVIEAIHPPAGAADAYHAVQAAEIAARASVSAERGRAAGSLAAAAERALDLTNGARGMAADEVEGARADFVRFTADRDAARAGGPAFWLERYFSSLTAALAKAPVTILDSRIDAGDAPVLDLRPPSAGAPPSTSNGD